MLMLLVLLVFAPCLFFLYMEVKHYKHKQIVNRIPGPATLPLVGNAHQMGKTPSEILNNLFLFWNKFDKDNYRLWIGYNSNIVISNVKTMEFILTSTTLTAKSYIYNMLHPWLGLGLLTSSGAKWFKHRKMITPSFHFKILQDFHEIMNENSTKFIEKLRTEAAGETIFDFQEMVHYLTLDVICETAMGVPINAMDNNDSEVVKAFKDMCYNINMRAFNPITGNQMLYRFSPDYPEYKRTLKILQDFTNDVIEKRLQALRERTENSETSTKTDDEFSRHKQAFLDTLLSASIDGRPLTKQEIYEEVSTFMFEGHDTTTSGISFAIYLLSRHPAIQQKVYEEQLEIFDNTNLQRDATFTEIGQMKYLDLVIKEAQRLYPSVPSIGREADCDYDMNGTLIPKGSSLNLFIMAMGYNEKTFEDPYRCRPERFDYEQRTTKPNPFEYVPFSAGPRNCIGQKFALLELKTVISKVVRCFEILPPLDELVSRDGYVQHFLGLSPEEQLKKPQPHKLDPQLSAVLTLKSENGIQLRLRARK